MPKKLPAKKTQATKKANNLTRYFLYLFYPKFSQMMHSGPAVSLTYGYPFPISFFFLNTDYMQQIYSAKILTAFGVSQAVRALCLPSMDLKVTYAFLTLGTEFIFSR